MPMFKQRIGGFTLIEVLVAIVVIGVGLLGMASMQLVGLRSNSSASYRSEAAALANDMAERMRANPAAMASFGGIAINCAAAPASLCSDTYPGVVAANCTSLEMATYDVNAVACGEFREGEAKGGARNLLPNGALAIVAVGAGNYDIDVTWDELDSDGAKNTRAVTVTVQ